MDESGDIRHSRKYNQLTKHWDVAAQKCDKDYAYIPILLANIFKKRQKDTRCMQDYREMPLSDPQRIAPTIAASVPLQRVNYRTYSAISRAIFTQILTESGRI